MKLILIFLFGFLAMQEPTPCKQAADIRARLGDNLDGLMYMPDTIPGRTTDSLITIRQWVEMLEEKCDSLKNTIQ